MQSRASPRCEGGGDEKEKKVKGRSPNLSWVHDSIIVEEHVFPLCNDSSNAASATINDENFPGSIRGRAAPQSRGESREIQKETSANAARIFQGQGFEDRSLYICNQASEADSQHLRLACTTACLMEEL